LQGNVNGRRRLHEHLVMQRREGQTGGRTTMVVAQENDQ
jgi:hypothetical protein